MNAISKLNIMRTRIIELKRTYFFFAMVAIMILLQSCGTMVYTSSSYGSLKSNTAKQEYRNKDTVANYIGANISIGEHDRNSFDNDNKFLVSVLAHRSKTKKYYNYYYGIGSGYGTHKFNLKQLTEKYTLWTFNSKVGINMNLPTSRMDWRLLGVEVGYTYESGPYQDKLSEIKEVELNSLVFNKKSIWQYNFYTEAIFKLNHGKVFGIEIFIGDILNKTGELKEYDASFYGISLSYKFDKYTISLCNEAAKEGIGSTKLSLTYQFH